MDDHGQGQRVARSPQHHPIQRRVGHETTQRERSAGYVYAGLVGLGFQSVLLGLALVGAGCLEAVDYARHIEHGSGFLFGGVLWLIVCRCLQRVRLPERCWGLARDGYFAVQVAFTGALACYGWIRVASAVFLDGALPMPLAGLLVYNVATGWLLWRWSPGDGGAPPE